MRRNNRFLLLIPLVFLGLFLSCRCAPKYEQVQPEAIDGGVTIRFVYIDDNAGAVCVSGTFNSWSGQSDCMNRSANVWSVTVSMPPGRYSYLFVVDGRDWREDPGCLLAEDSGFGTKNSVLIVE
jgi:1,4-alpha-glucan branching enzyme